MEEHILEFLIDRVNRLGILANNCKLLEFSELCKSRLKVLVGKGIELLDLIDAEGYFTTVAR